MKSPKKLAAILAAALITLTAYAAQQSANQGQDAQLSDLQIAAIQAAGISVADLQQMPPGQVPLFGTFYYISWLGQIRGWPLGPPLPFDNLANLNLPIYWAPVYLIDGMGPSNAPSNIYLVDDSSVAGSSFQQQASIDQMLTTLEKQPSPGSAKHGSKTSPPPMTGGGISDPQPLFHAYVPDALYLDVPGPPTNGYLYVVLWNTTPGLAYDLLSAPQITNGMPWNEEQQLIGAEGQNWTGAWISMIGRKSLFLWARSWIDSSGQGVPDWWLLRYFGTTSVDIYADPDGDGWTTIEEFYNGTDPTRFNTPPPPRNVTARLDATGTNVILSWQSGGGPVTNYAVRDARFPLELAQLSPGTFSYTDSRGYVFLNVQIYSQPAYFVRANFADGSHADSQPVGVELRSLTPAMALLRSSSGPLLLVVASVPPNLSRIIVSREKADGSFVQFSVYPSNLVNGVVQIPYDSSFIGQDAFGNWLTCQMVATNGDLGQQIRLWPYRAEEMYEVVEDPGYLHVDARQDIKENLSFLLRSATVNHPFSYVSGIQSLSPLLDELSVSDDAMWYPEDYCARSPSPSSYEYYGFHTFSSNFNYSVMQEVRPVQENFLLSNFVFNAQDGGSASAWANDLCDSDPFFRSLTGPKYLYTGTGTEASAPVAMQQFSCRWLYCAEVLNGAIDDCVNSDLGISIVNSTNFLLSTAAKNVYGLPINSVRAVLWPSTNTPVLQPGVPGPFNVWEAQDWFPEVADPVLQTTNYYFASQTSYLISRYYYGVTNSAPPFPGSPTFNVTNGSPVLVTGLGQPITVAGWAKQAIANGATGKYAYLEQYFDKAVRMDTNGASTNQTGALSLYGEFFPTEPGPTALLTLTNWDVNERGTGVVHVIALCTDANHDGVIDPTLHGPDFTSPGRPFRFWVNDDNDSDDTGGNDIPGWPAAHRGTTNGTDGIVNGARDLVDFFPVCLNMQSFLQALTTNDIQTTYQVWLRQQDGAVNYVTTSLQPTNAHSYLTDTNVAASLAAAPVTPIGPDGVRLLNGFLYDLRSWRQGHSRGSQ